MEGDEKHASTVRYSRSFTYICNAPFLKLDGGYMATCYIIFYTLYTSMLFCDYLLKRVWWQREGKKWSGSPMLTNQEVTMNYECWLPSERLREVIIIPRVISTHFQLTKNNHKNWSRCLGLPYSGPSIYLTSTWRQLSGIVWAHERTRSIGFEGKLTWLIGFLSAVCLWKWAVNLGLSVTCCVTLIFSFSILKCKMKAILSISIYNI